MSTDARLSTGLPAHPKTKKLIRRLGHGGAWSLVCLILWARDNRPDGDLAGMTTEDIELAVDWRGDPDAFVAALRAVGFLDGEHEGGYRLHDWSDHQPWSSGSSKRSQKARWAALCKQHGRAEAARQMPEYAELVSASTTEKGATSTETAARSTFPLDMPEEVNEGESATSREIGAPSTQSSATSRVLAAKTPAPSPSPSPSPRAKAKAITPAPHARSPQEPHAREPMPTEAGRACALLKQAGCARVNPAHPDLLAALAEGVSPEALVHTYRENPNASNPFAWAIATARGRHAEGARPVAAGPPRRDLSDQPSRTRTALENLQGRKSDGIPTAMAQGRGSRRLHQAGDAEP